MAGIVLADNGIGRITKLGVIVLADNGIKDMKTKKPRKPFDLRGELTGQVDQIATALPILIMLLDTP